MKEGYEIKIYKRHARWTGHLGHMTELSKKHPKTIVDFISSINPDKVFWSWMPRNDDIVDIVKALLEEPHSDDFKKKLRGVIS